MNHEYDESIVEKLPLIGKPKGIKTKAQGRNVSLTNDYIDESILNRGRVAKFNLRLTCNTIMKHRRTSEKQKEIARKIFERNYCTSNELNIIISIMRRYK